MGRLTLFYKMNDNNIKLIIGNHGGGKSTYIYNYFLDNCINVDGTLDLDKKFYLVVPEQDTQDKQDMIIGLAKKQNHGIFNIDVISFDRLFYMVCKELNINIDREKIIDDDIKRLVLRLALQNLEKNGTEFIYFKNMKNKVGFTDKLKSAMSELYSYNIDKEVIDKVLLKTDNDRLKEKMQELSLIQEEFKKILKDKDFSIQEDKLNILYKIIDKSHICDNAVFAFDGFTGFTPIQKDIFYKICEKSKETYVSIDIRDVDVKSII
ncbi:MAG: hypothetical protein MJ151_03305, partial [Lachnospiraceae bacterium]|nr:hypothetical protein [Lachnospiraceae bacterium]